ncbi:MAG TPA: YfcE family phosphodiesterase, partial [Desulfobulbus sp.]|nr:YfcE family phosphodiesterase [Desulfobulbus sp.]
MKIAILSDSHDHIPNFARAINRANSAGAELLIHCGDLISPFMLQYLFRFNGPIHLIYGNNAGDQHLISSRCATDFDRITHHGIEGS